MKKIKKQTGSLQEWFFIDDILENGILQKNNQYMKLLRINPINYQLKSELEKQSILNAYKAFLKTYSSNIQIIIQSKKEDFSKHIDKIKQQNKSEKSSNKNIMVNLSEQYIEFINQKNKEKNSSSKNFFILIYSQKESNSLSLEMLEQELREKYLKIKDALSRCGNEVVEIKEKNEIKNVLASFFKKQEYFYG